MTGVQTCALPICLYLLQRVRDEAHRFAITYHRKKRGAALTVSELDGVPGLGRSRRATLLRHFGSVRRLSEASAEQIAGLPGIGQRTAEAVVAALQAGQHSAGQHSQAPADGAARADQAGSRDMAGHASNANATGGR